MKWTARSNSRNNVDQLADHLIGDEFSAVDRQLLRVLLEDAERLIQQRGLETGRSEHVLHGLRVQLRVDGGADYNERGWTCRLDHHINRIDGYPEVIHTSLADRTRM